MNAAAQPHSECRQVLIDLAANQDTEVIATTAPPLIATPYTTAPFICPHGQAYWIEPTSEQIARWAKEGQP